MDYFADDAHELTEEERYFRSILEDQLSRYPQMQIQDLYKLIHQGSLGSEHAVRDVGAARSWLEEEVSSLQGGPEEHVVDRISHQGKIVRVNLRPYIQAGKDTDSLLDAFVRTANEHQGSTELLNRNWTYARRMASEGKLPFNIEEMDDYLAGMEKQGFPPVHHSSVYEEAYRPAYRVVAAVYITELLGEAGQD